MLGLAIMFSMAFAEGANDVSKVAATLVGSGIASYKKAILFGTICTALGALMAVILAKGGGCDPHKRSHFFNRSCQRDFCACGSPWSDGMGAFSYKDINARQIV